MKTVYENPWFAVVKDGRFHYLRESNSDNGAAILVLEEDHFVFVKLNRPAHHTEVIEIPRGYGIENENSRECAIRELFEETGYQIRICDIEELGMVMPNSAILSSKISVFLARVQKSQKISDPDSEISEVMCIPVNNIRKEVASGLISDGFSLSALALYWSKYG